MENREEQCKKFDKDYPKTPLNAWRPVLPNPITVENYDNPYEGLFLMNSRRFQYTVNHTKKIYYSLDETTILFQDHTKIRLIK